MDESPKQGFTSKLRKLIRREEAGDDEVLAVVDEFKKQGVIEEDEAEMISNVMEMSDTVAGDIMTHRTKIDAVSSEETVEDALKYMMDENHSRYPMYDESIDNIKGMLYLKDMMRAYLDGNIKANVSTVAREAMYVPESMPIDALFEKLRDERTHIAVVVDEYGQTAGIVGMEDIIEEIVGDIMDEYDDEDEVNTEDNGVYHLTPDTRLDELDETVKIDIKEEDLDNFDTLNGLMISLLGHIPAEGEKSTVTYNGYEFLVSSKEGRVLSEIIATKLPEEKNEEE